ncbi:MAG: hypothetical protein ACQEXJ_23075 [Myxococcota bacterium]
MADHTPGPQDRPSFEAAPHASPTEQVGSPTGPDPFASFKDPLPHIKRAGEAAWKVWSDPPGEIPAFGKARSLVGYATVLVAAVLVLPLLLSAFAGTFRIFGGVLLWAVVATAVFYVLLLGALKLVHKHDAHWMDCLGLVSVVWLPLVPALLLSSLLGKASGELGAAIFGFSVLVAGYFLSIGLRTIPKLSEKAALYTAAVTYALFLGLLLRGITRAYVGAMVPPGAF